MLLVIALVALCYCGGKLCPAVLRQNKEMLLGVAIGMALCSFMDLRMEGYDDPTVNRAFDEAELAQQIHHVKLACAVDTVILAAARRMCASGEIPPESCAGLSVGDSSN